MSLLALILATAQRIEKVIIDGQRKSRKIDVSVDEKKQFEDFRGGVIFGNSEEIIIIERK